MKDLFKFERLVGISSLFIASCAAFFSIIGIGMLFSGSALASMIMASSLEIGKLVATSFLYRYWTKTKLLLKIYLISAVVILMIITSFGVFGYLTSAYQQSAIESKLAEDKILVINDQKKYTEDKINSAKKRIESIVALRNSQEARLGESMTNVVISRNPIQLAQIQEQTKELIDKSEKDIESENSKIQKGIDELQSFDKKIAEIKMESGSKKDIQTFKFISEQYPTLNFNLSYEEETGWGGEVTLLNGFITTVEEYENKCRDCDALNSLEYCDNDCGEICNVCHYMGEADLDCVAECQDHKVYLDEKHVPDYRLEKA